MPGGTEEILEMSQSVHPVCGPEFEPVTFCVRSSNVITSTAAFDRKNVAWKEE
jgi:hypothetical protein